MGGFPAVLALMSAFGLGGMAASEVQAQTISAKRIAQAHRLQPLRKITVGPDDQYDGTLSPDGRYLVYTHKADLVAHLRIQEVKSGEVRDLMPLNADSQEASFAPDGRLAFNYFRYNARGDICVADVARSGFTPLKESGIRCLKRGASDGKTQRSNPFWKSASEVGYLERDVGAIDARIVSENLATGAKSVLAQGRVWSPSMRATGKFLVYNETGSGPGRQLKLKELGTGRIFPVQLQLPGLSGFAELSDDESHVYFSHFINDTNEDHTIDGGDNAVIFRVPVAQVMAAQGKQEILPEQLTSVDTSCSFPVPFRNSLVVTCAFEGSLDVYDLAATGVVPIEWDLRRLKNALDTSRTYHDRILLLNSLKYRFRPQAREMDERLLADHILNDDSLAARFYADRLAREATASEREFLRTLRIYLEARELKSAQPPGAFSREYLRRIQELEARLGKSGAPSRMQSIARGWLKVFSGKPRLGESFIRDVHFKGPGVRRLERVLHFELANEVFSGSLPKRLPELMAAHREAIRAPELDEQSQLFYAFTMLRRLAETVPVPAERIARIGQLDRELPPSASALLKAEIAVLKLIQATDEKSKVAQYAELDKHMIKARSNYFLRQALFIRAIVSFADAAQFRFLEFIAANWLRATSQDDTEFAYAREAFAVASLDRAYDGLAKNQKEYAANFFYQSLSLTDDLESHYGYVVTRASMGERKVIDERYKALQAQNLVADSMNFVRALLQLIDSEPRASQDPAYVAHLDGAIESLQKIEFDRDSPIRYLLLGYCKLEKMRRLASGYEINAELFQDAHRYLMLAYDLSRGNDRIRASALMNLGFLHSRAQNHGLATRFFSLRKRLGFLDQDEHARFTWLYARSLAYSRQPEQGALELSEVPKAEARLELREREAFFLMNAGRFKESAAKYREVLASVDGLNERNRAAIHLSYGYVLLKSGQRKAAADALNVAIESAKKLKPVSRTKEKLIDFHPERILLSAYGFLAQCSTGPARTAALESRLALLLEARGLVDEWPTAVIQTRLQIADSLSGSDEPRAGAAIRLALRETEKYADENQYLGQAVFRATVAGLVESIRRPGSLQSDDRQRLKKLVDNSILAFEAQKAESPLLDFQKVQLRILATASQIPVVADRSKMFQGVLSSVEAARLKSSAPGRWQDVSNLAVALAK